MVDAGLSEGRRQYNDRLGCFNRARGQRSRIIWKRVCEVVPLAILYSLADLDRVCANLICIGSIVLSKVPMQTSVASREQPGAVPNVMLRHAYVFWLRRRETVILGSVVRCAGDVRPVLCAFQVTRAHEQGQCGQLQASQALAVVSDHASGP